MTEPTTREMMADLDYILGVADLPESDATRTIRKRIEGPEVSREKIDAFIMNDNKEGFYAYLQEAGVRVGEGKK